MRSSRVPSKLVSAAIVVTLLLWACRGNEEGPAATAAQTLGGNAPILSEADCRTLSLEYTLAVQEARACDLGAGQCTLRVWDNLGCSCPIYVNPRNKDAHDKMKSVFHAWYGGGCSNQVVACQMNLCRQTKKSVCTLAPSDPLEPVVGICGD